jgi:hypothetical protein
MFSEFDPDLSIMRVVLFWKPFVLDISKDTETLFKANITSDGKNTLFIVNKQYCTKKNTS